MDDKIGQTLRQAREARSLSLEQATQATRIRMHYLKAMEAGDLSYVPSQAQARGFLRTYARYLNLDPGPLLAALDGMPAAAESDAEQLALGEKQADGTSAIQKKGEAFTRQSAAIFSEIGERLQKQRELLGLSMEDVERATHLRIHYLKALEAGNLDGLPSPVQGRGMLKNYSGFLGMDPEPLLLRYAEALQAGLAAKRATRPVKQASNFQKAPRQASPVKRFFSAEFFFAGIIVVFLSAFVIWGILRVSSMRSQQEPDATAPSIADVLLQAPPLTSSAPTPEETQLALTPQVPTPEGNSTAEENIALIPTFEAQESGTPAGGATGQAPPPAAGLGGVQIHLVVRQRSWVRVTVDGEIEFEGRVSPGNAYTYSGTEQVEILAGNGAALHVYHNQNDLGPLGAFGEVVNRIYTPEGVATPVVTNTPAEFPSVEPTASPSPGMEMTGTPVP